MEVKVMFTVMVSAGEASGDLHGATVAKALKAAKPGTRVLGMGGDQMRAAGVEVVYDIAGLGVFGLVEILKKLPKLRLLRRFLSDLMDFNRPDVLVVIDYGGFNIPLAKIAKAKGIPVVYYIPPKVWVWGRGRAQKIAATVERVATIFPFETDIYREAGAKVTFVGHPLIDIVKPSLSKEQAYRLFGADPTQPVVLLLPGSRAQEIDNLLPPMLAAAEIISEKVPCCQFYLPVASTISREIVQNIISNYKVPVQLTSGNAYDLMQIGSVAIAASGTVTLETSLLKVPTVIIYKVAALTWLVGRRLVKIPYFGLPNIIAGRQVVPELLQDAASPCNIAAEAVAILTDETLRRRIESDLEEVRRKLGASGAVDRVASLILEIAAAGREGKL